MSKVKKAAAPKKPKVNQPTRLVKCVCGGVCGGYTVRTTEKWLEKGAPICPVDNIAMTANRTKQQIAIKKGMN